MAQVKQSVAAFLVSFFGSSEKSVSEKLTTEEYNQFTSEAQQLQEKVEGLQTQVSGLESFKTTLEGSITLLQGEKATLETEKATLQGSLTAAEADRDKYKSWFEKQAGAGAKLPEGDASNQVANEMSDYNAGALVAFRKANPK